MSFLYHLLIAILIFGAGIALATNSGDPSDESHYYFLAGAVGAQVWLAVAAISLRSKRLANFDMIVASELIIALGILALICGIIIAVIFTSQSIDISRGLSFETLRPLLTPFAEGLFAAGFAPVLATLLRQIEVLKYGVEHEDAAASKDAVHAELQTLRNEVHATTESFKNLAAACERSQAIFENSAASLDSSTDACTAGMAKIQTALGDLGSVVEAAGDGFQSGIGNITARLKDHESQLSRSTQEMNELAEATRRFKAATEEGTTLLNGLRAVIDSVERFVHPDRSPQ